MRRLYVIFACFILCGMLFKRTAAADDFIQNQQEAIESFDREDLSFLIGMTVGEVTALYPDLEQDDLPHAHYILSNADLALTFTMDPSVGALQFPITGVTIWKSDEENSILGYKVGMVLEDVRHELSEKEYHSAKAGGYDSDWSEDLCECWEKDGLTVVMFYDTDHIITMLRLRNNNDWTGWEKGEFD